MNSDGGGCNDSMVCIAFKVVHAFVVALGPHQLQLRCVVNNPVFNRLPLTATCCNLPWCCFV
jgi:hypothetical protein